MSQHLHLSPKLIYGVFISIEKCWRLKFLEAIISAFKWLNDDDDQFAKALM